MKNKKKKKIIKDYTKIKARFGIYAKELDFDYISELLGIKPTYKMLAKNIKIREYQEDGWEYNLGYVSSTDINEQVEKVLLLLIDKADVINDICNKFNATTQLSVIVKAKSKKYYPYLSLSNENIERMNKLNISLFDIDLL